jgi:Type I 3-dehydroquinase
LHCDAAGGGEVPEKTRVIVSHHDFEATPDDETLRGLVAEVFACGGDIAKIAATATDISDSARMLRLLQDQPGVLSCLASPCHCLSLSLYCGVSGRRKRAESLDRMCFSLPT